MATGKPVDVLIAGGGIAGLSLAVALRRALGDGVSVTLCDPAYGTRGEGTRASALAAGPRRMLERLGAWDAVAPDAQPILDMVITDSRTSDVVRPAYLTFGGEIEPGEPYAHMVFNDQVTVALEACAAQCGVAALKAGVRRVARASTHMDATLTDGSVLSARLLVVADGARSRLREALGMNMVGWDYGQSGIVATIGHTRDHEGKAYEHFLPAGPFAILPLTQNRSSIVWNESEADAREICALEPEDFMSELETRFGHAHGELTLLDRPRAFPFGYRIARDFVQDRVALLGDAAHLVHPIAGQGLNLGLRDVASLAEILVDAMRLGLDPGSLSILRDYERARRYDTLKMGLGMDALNRLFSNDLTPLRMLRDLGLGIVDRMPRLKRHFIDQASAVSDGPRLLRGDAL